MAVEWNWTTVWSQFACIAEEREMYLLGMSINTTSNRELPY